MVRIFAKSKGGFIGLIIGFLAFVISWIRVFQLADSLDHAVLYTGAILPFVFHVYVSYLGFVIGILIYFFVYYQLGRLVHWYIAKKGWIK